MATPQEILARRKLAAQGAKSGVTPKNAPAKVEPAVTRPAVQPLRPKSQRAVEPEEFAEDDDEGDSPPAPRRVIKKLKSKPAADATPDRSSAREAARALTVLNNGSAGALAVRAPDRTRQLDSRDTLIPRLKLSQAMSKVNTDDIVRQGNFYQAPDNKNLGKEIYVVILDMRKSRSYFEQNQGVLCRSFDLIKGEGDPGILCEGTDDEIATLAEDERGCPLRLWGERDESGRSEPPACGLNYNYIMLVLDPDDLTSGRSQQAIFTLRSTGTKIARAMNTMCMNNGDWTDSVLKMTVTTASNRRGTYYLPSVEYWGESSGEVKSRAQRLSRSLSGTSVRASMEASDQDD